MVLFVTNVLRCICRTNKRLFTLRTLNNSSKIVLCANNGKLRSTNYIGNIRRFTESESDKGSTGWVTVTFVLRDGRKFTRRAQVGEKLQDCMNGEEFESRGIGACGGTISCSTCHVIVSPEDYEKLGKLDSDEDDLITYAPDYCETSRLACGIDVAAWMEGMEFKIPSKVRDQREDDMGSETS